MADFPDGLAQKPIPYRDMTRPKHGSGRRVSIWQPLVFGLPIALLSLAALLFTAGPGEVMTTVSHGLNLVDIPVRSIHLPVPSCHRTRCRPVPRPSPTVTASGGQTASDPPTPTVSPKPTSTATATPTPTPTPTSSAPTAPTSDPTSPPVTVCGNSGLLAGPSTAPAGAVTVPAGDNSAMFAYQLPANATYYFAAGTHYLGSGPYSQIKANSNDTFIGAPGAIISGTDGSATAQNHFAIAANSGLNGVTVEYLTIQGFAPPGSQGAVNPNSNDNWTVAHNTIQDNLPGSALMVGSNNTIEYNCLTANGQYAFNAYQSPSDPDSSAVTGGPQNITLSDNEISYNDTCNFEATGKFPISTPSGCTGQGEANGCGCSGGGKFWHDEDVTVEDNYVHNNYNVGLWVDTNNDGFNIQGNYFSGNYASALIYEVSYNALIKNNTFVDNALGSGPADSGFPDPAIYISESGGDSRVPNGFGYSTLSIQSNTFTNNWGGVILWENANRFCGDGFDNACTLVAPSVATMSSCPAGLANSSKDQPGDTPDYFDLCRWKVQNVTVSGNVFNLTPSAIGSACTLANKCGFVGVFSEYGSTKPYAAWPVPLNIADHQNNVFSGNTYNGPWNFDSFALGNVVSWSQWTSGYKDSGSGATITAQDAGSTYNA
jgi:parallel beta-helix repeat protein